MIITLLLLVDTTGQMPCIMLAVITHEFGHLLAMSLFKNFPRAIRLLPFAVDIEMNNSITMSPIQEVILHSAGILSNLLNICIFINIYRVYQSEYFIILSAANAGIAIFNMLPIQSLDGLNIFFSFLQCLKISSDKAEKITSIVSVGVTVIMSFFGLWLTIKYYNLTMLLFCIYIFIITFLPKK